MDKLQAQQFVHRWQTINEVQQQESRGATLELRWRQLNAAYCLAMGLGLLSASPYQMQEHEPWMKLKAIFLRRSRT